MENLDVFDENMNPLSPSVESIDTVHKKGLWHQTFACWVINKSTKSIYLQLRGPKNYNDPNTFDISASGHLSAGEKPLDGFRELEEEIGISYDENLAKYVGIRRNKSSKDGYINREFCHTFFYTTDKPIDELSLQPGEVTGVFSISIDRAIELFSNKVSSVSIQGVCSYKDVFKEEVREISCSDMCNYQDRCIDSQYYLNVMNLIQNYINGEDVSFENVENNEV